MNQISTNPFLQHSSLVILTIATPLERGVFQAQLGNEYLCASNLHVGVLIPNKMVGEGRVFAISCITKQLEVLFDHV